MPTATVPQIRDRIVELRRVRARDLRPNPRNWRKHPKAQQRAMQAILEEVGYAGAALARETPGGLELIDGHLRAELTPDQEIPVLVVDVTEEEAVKILATHDPIAAMAEVDDEALRTVMAEARLKDDQLRAMVQDLLPPVDPQAGLTDPDAVPEPPAEPETKPGDLYVLGDHRLLCGDSGSERDVDRLLAGASIHLVNTDPPYNVRVEPRSNNAIAAGNSSFRQTHHQKLDLARHPEKSQPTHRQMRAKDRPLENDFVSDEAFEQLLQAWFGNLARVLAPGRGFYIWGGYANCANYPPVLKAHELYFSQAIIWVKEHPVLTRKDFMGNHEWCQPAGTQVSTPHGAVPIESLRDGDRVLSFSRHSSAVVGFKRGFGIRRTVREYDGNLYGVSAGERTTWCTDGHPWTVKLLPDAGWTWCVYVMRRGDWWRVGKCRVITTWGFGLKHRLRSEGADEAWILSTHRTNFDALAAEQAIVSLYGIPSIYWEPTPSRSAEMIAGLYERLDLERLRRSALQAIRDHDRSPEFPFVARGATRAKVGRRIPLTVRACNLLPEVMAVPKPTGRLQPNFEWAAIRAIEVQPHRGPVYSMDVERHHHYIADGLVTHNCFYGWRKGATHQFFGPANVPDVWSIKKISPQKMVHLTEKPVELATKAMQLSSRPGENVLDLFGGSGSTLIGAEQIERKAYLMEIDPAYCDVIVQRWEAFTGRKVVRGDG